MAERNRQRAMPSHGMAEDRLALGIGRKMLGDQAGQLFGDVAPHAVIAREWLFCGIDIKSGAKPEIVEACRIAGHISAWAGVRRDKDQAQFGTRRAIFALFRAVGVRAAEASHTPNHRQLHALLLWRNEDRKGPARSAL